MSVIASVVLSALFFGPVNDLEPLSELTAASSSEAFQETTGPAGTAAPPPVLNDARGSEVFVLANSLYEQGRFADAILAYESLVEAGFADEDLFFNLGNAWHRAGRPGPAILAYERALKIAPGDTQTRENLEFVASKIVDQVAEEDQDSGPFAALVAWHARLSPPLVTAAFVLVWVFFNLFISVALFAPGDRVRRLAVYAVAASLIAVLATSGLLGPLIYRHDAVVRAVVLDERADLQSVPGGGLKLATVHEGLAVRVRGVRGDWLRVVLPNGMQGWLSRRAVGIV